MTRQTLLAAEIFARGVRALCNKSRWLEKHEDEISGEEREREKEELGRKIEDRRVEEEQGARARQGPGQHKG